jgi:hypothetical protein
VQKLNNDYFYGNLTISNLGGIDLDELNALELVFLEMLDFDVHVNENEYQAYEGSLPLFFRGSLDQTKVEETKGIFQTMLDFEQFYMS